MGQVTIGANTFDIYGTHDGAKAYFAGRLATTAWDAADSTTQKKALVTSTYALDAKSWQGSKTSDVQALEWPRTGVTCRGNAVDPNTIPANFVKGAYELALYLLTDPTLIDKYTLGTNIRRAKAGEAEVEFFTPTLGSKYDFKFPARVHELIGCFLASAVNLSSGAAYGTDEESGFTDCDFKLTEGFK